ncbi:MULTISPECIES: OsmC family protein [Flavobacterium]|uniref:OsmC family protein n=1 Tax=Flavobacterium TaxID=237 RepID=UPI001FCC448A|nr:MULTISPECIES: OsmC family protein [Flavobacterium]UOK43648.1 OsmC family protein [Flavobacterium enshiense]
MKISASIKSSLQIHEVNVETENNKKSISIAPKIEGYGSSINGGELLFLSLATCFCNDLYREATKKNIKIDSLEIIVSGEFGGEGEAAKNITYKVQVHAKEHSDAQICELIEKVDKIAEIHNTLRQGINVKLII